MWSSLSSYLYSDQTSDVVASPSPAAVAKQKPPKINTALSPRSPSSRSSPLTTALSVSGGSNSNESTRKLNKSSFDSKSDNVSILRGVIVGMKGTGKTSLIRRLRGEDPFQKHQTKSDQQRSGADKKKLMALVPWNVPEDAEKIGNLALEQEERVQLYVSESVAFVQSQDEQMTRKEWFKVLQSQRGKEWNFVIWMIDPDMKDMLKYLQSGLDILFPLTAATSKSEKIREPPLVRHLCILLNFRDMQQDNKSSILNQVKETIKSIHKRVEEGNVNLHGKLIKSPIIVAYESSMMDCYGLHQLHSFITLPYLAQKEQDLLRRVKLAQKQQAQMTKAITTSKVIDYDDFVATNDNVVAEEKPDKQTSERKTLEEEKDRLKKQLKQQKEVLELKQQKQVPEELKKQKQLESKTHKKNSPVIMGDEIVSNEQRKKSPPEAVPDSNGLSRKLFQTPSKPVSIKPKLPPKIVADNSLESFFAEDESEDEEIVMLNETKSEAFGSRVQVLDSDDSTSDSDDDFFIDISGTRSSSIVSKKRIPKIEPIIIMKSNKVSKTSIEDEKKGKNAPDTSDKNRVDASQRDSESIQSKSTALNNFNDPDVVAESTESNDSVGHDSAKNDEEDHNGEETTSTSITEDESGNVVTITEPVVPDSGEKNRHYVAEDGEEEKKIDLIKVEGKEVGDDEASSPHHGKVNVTKNDEIEDKEVDSAVGDEEVNDDETSNTGSIQVDTNNMAEEGEKEDASKVEGEIVDIDVASVPCENEIQTTNEGKIEGNSNFGGDKDKEGERVGEEDTPSESIEDVNKVASTIIGDVKGEEDETPNAIEVEAIEKNVGTESKLQGAMTNDDVNLIDTNVEIPEAHSNTFEGESQIIGTENVENGEVVSNPPDGEIVEGIKDDGEGKGEEEEKASVPPKQPTEHEADLSEGENVASAAPPQEKSLVLDDDDESEDEFIIPAFQEHLQDPDNSAAELDDTRQKSTLTPPPVKPSAPPKQSTEHEAALSEGGNVASAAPPQEKILVLDDDDESEDEFIIPAFQEHLQDSDNSAAELDDTRQKSTLTQPPVKPNATKVNGTATSHNQSMMVSSAALAAIEQARLEAEQMMAKTQPQPTKPKKEKKKKKEKTKKEKKAKKSKKKEASS